MKIYSKAALRLYRSQRCFFISAKGKVMVNLAQIIKHVGKELYIMKTWVAQFGCRIDNQNNYKCGEGLYGLL